MELLRAEEETPTHRALQLKAIPMGAPPAPAVLKVAVPGG